MIEFDYDSYLNKTDEIITRTEPFALGHTSEYLPVLQWTLGNAFGKDCRHRETMLCMQLDGIAKTLQTGTDWIPYLEPWHGVGVFAEAFGCPFEWRDDDAPWTHPLAGNIEQLRELKKPSVDDCSMLQYVLDTIRYFDRETGGMVYIAPTDTQSPLDTVSLILETDFLFYAAVDYPEDLHRLLSDVTDLIIEFTLIERQLTRRPAMPGHNAWCHPGLSGLGLSEDVLCMVGPDFFEEFSKPYNERIANALGGISVHSCGVWKQNFDTVSRMNGVVQVDLAVHKQMDPSPNCPETVRDGLRGSDFLVKVRCPGDEVDILDRIYVPDLRLMWEVAWEDDPAKRQANYDDAKRRFERLAALG